MKLYNVFALKQEKALDLGTEDHLAALKLYL